MIEMKVLYISAFCSARLQKILSDGGRRDPGYAVHKFNSLLIRGMQANEVTVQALSVIPTSPSRSRRKVWNEGREQENGISIKYVPFINVKGLRQLCVFTYSFIFVIIWSLRVRGSKCLVCDALNISQNMGALLASKLVGVKSVGILTDMPGLMVTQKKGSRKTKFLEFSNMSFLNLYSGYVFLTEQMNGVVNKHNRPYIVMEGMVDSSICDAHSEQMEKQKRIVMYAGGLHEKYGLKMLVDGFLSLHQKDVALHIYGNGPYVVELKAKSLIDSRVCYKGSVANDVIVRAEKEATLLVNPRPTHEEFTKYSFPSKNMEYMASGTPLLTTRLPGMPKEYHKYVFLFEDESTEGYADKLNEVLSLPDATLSLKGQEAKRFVLNEKSNTSQGRRVVQLIKQLLTK